MDSKIPSTPTSTVNLTEEEPTALHMKINRHIARGDIWGVMLLIKIYKEQLDKYHYLAYVASQYWKFKNGEEILKFVIKTWGWTPEKIQQEARNLYSPKYFSLDRSAINTLLERIKTGELVLD